VFRKYSLFLQPETKPAVQSYGKESPFEKEKIKMMQHKLDAFGRLLTIMDELREQCPWDRKQTFQSLRKLTIEELYELADAILKEDLEEIREEVGDLMLHLVFYAKIAEEKGAFDIADAINEECDKLIQRHPHIYGDVEVSNEEEVKKNWEQLKLKAGKKSVLGGVPNSLPAMVKAYRMQEKTSQVGFDWTDGEQVWEKVEEEMREFREAMQDTRRSRSEKEEEFGDILFSMINYARFQGIDPEAALARVNQKFKARFEFIEAHAKRDLKDLTPEEMDALWEEAKQSKK
jgi:XTP/dITP diphosphohydrolase